MKVNHKLTLSLDKTEWQRFRIILAIVNNTLHGLEEPDQNGRVYLAGIWFNFNEALDYVTDLLQKTKIDVIWNEENES